jgi:putative tryptophan/tyrosine transport system substrate-binding protein
MRHDMILRTTKALRLIVAGVFTCLLLFSSGFANGAPGMFTVGVVCEVKTLLPVFEGFKAGVNKLGYVEGKDVKYLVSITGGNKKETAAEVKGLLTQKIDLLLTIGNQTAMTAKEVVKGTDIPVLATACMNPVESGLAESINHPGGSITGVMVPKIMPKALEWLKIIIPDLKKVYLPYNPDDEASETALIGVDQIASRLGITIVYGKIHSVEEVVRAIENLPKDIQAVLRVSSPTLAPQIDKMRMAAIKKGLPVGAISQLEKEEALVVFSSDLYETGNQASRLANQIHLGVKPSDIPFEVSEAYLTINLKTAKKLGLKIPDDILSQAKTIIR